LARNRSWLLAFLLIDTRTSGGSSETEVKALTVSPRGSDGPWTVTTVTPVPKQPRQVRSS
jgi:hypothetical protein